MKFYSVWIKFTSCKNFNGS